MTGLSTFTFLPSCKSKQATVVSTPAVAASPVTASTNNPASQNQEDSLVLTFARTPCFGKCPSFEISVYSSGYATFNGRYHVLPQGMNYQYVDINEVMQICREAKEAGYFRFNPMYDAGIPDLPGVVFYLHLGNEKLKVTNNNGEVPEALNEIERRIDQFFKGINWLPLPTNSKQ